MNYVISGVTLAALAIGVAAGVANAQARSGFGGHSAMTFETLDVDGSGEIDATDLDALRAERFAGLDTNGDGSVTEDEFIAQAQRDATDRASRMFERMDADGDGVLSRDALEGRAGHGMSGRFLTRADADGSGGVNADEFEALQSRMADHRGSGNRHKWGQKSQ